uniref:Peptidase M12B domain-containing protein n=1 Tax=Meloidogyne enterolobii TaxID=390850 RepID=A0A6V7WR62_MELEN|nr:unnamed protein product [Meloidogyne enterolobii]
MQQYSLFILPFILDQISTQLSPIIKQTIKFGNVSLVREIRFSENTTLVDDIKLLDRIFEQKIIKEQSTKKEEKKIIIKQKKRLVKDKGPRARILLVGDHSLFEKFFGLYGEDEYAAYNGLSLYLNGIFSQLKSVFDNQLYFFNKFSLRLEMVGMPMIILRPKDCPLRGPLQNFISQHYLDKINTTLINSSVPLTNSSIQIQLEKQQKQMNYVWRSLDSLVAVQWASKWVKQNEPTGNLPIHEHLMIITALDLLSHRNDSSTQGMAYVRAICRGYDSVSIVAAHELAHSIGASHDGFGESENCSARQNFLMTPVSASHPFDAKFGDTFGNAFILSKCSRQQIEDFFNSSDSNCLWSEEEEKNLFWSMLEEEFQSSLNALNKNGSNILFDDENYLLEEEKQLMNNKNGKEEEIKFLKILPGEQFNPSRQCQIAFGPSYGLCQRIDFLLLTSDSCRRLWCKDRRQRRWGPCETKGFLPLMDGSSCGDRKWCIRGQCRPMPGVSEEGNKNSNNEENKSSVNCNDDLNHTFCSNFQHSQLHSFCQMISFSRICCSTCRRPFIKKIIKTKQKINLNIFKYGN